MSKFNLKNFITVIPTTMKLEQLINSMKSLDHLSKQKLSAVISFKLAALIGNANKIVSDFEKVRFEKIKEYGEEVLKDEKKTGEWQVKKENNDTFKKEMEELLNEEVTLNIPEIKIVDFAGVSIEPMYLVQLDWLIKE